MALTAFSFLSIVSGLVVVTLTFVYCYVKHVSYDYWRKRKVVFEEPSFPFGNLASVVSGKINPVTSGKMKLIFGTVNIIGGKLKNCFEQLLDQDVKVSDILGRFTTEVISATTFGIKTDSSTNPECEFRVHGKKVFEPPPVMNALFTLAPRILEILKMPYFDIKVRKFFIGVFEEAMDVRLKENVVSKPRDFLDLLIQLVQNGYVVDDEGNAAQVGEKEHSAEEKLMIRQTLAQAFVFFLAGFETSSLAATYALFELARTPDAKEKLRSEIFQVLEKHNGLTYESLNDMPYFTKVINETLRIYPSVMVLNRLCTESIDLLTTDLRIEKGMDILIPITGLQSDPDIWPNPEKFDLERFSLENIASRHSYKYLPFGEGPRVCIGVRFGVMSVKIALISALTSCRFEVSKQTILPIIIDSGSLIVYDSKNPIYLKLRPL